MSKVLLNKMDPQTASFSRPEADQRLREIAAEIFHEDVASVDLAMGPDDIDRWDSLNHLRLITEVEAAFSLKLSMQQIQQVQSLADLLKFIP